MSGPITTGGYWCPCFWRVLRRPPFRLGPSVSGRALRTGQRMPRAVPGCCGLGGGGRSVGGGPVSVSLRCVRAGGRSSEFCWLGVSKASGASRSQQPRRGCGGVGDWRLPNATPGAHVTKPADSVASPDTAVERDAARDPTLVTRSRNLNLSGRGATASVTPRGRWSATRWGYHNNCYWTNHRRCAAQATGGSAQSERNTRRASWPRPNQARGI